MKLKKIISLALILVMMPFCTAVNAADKVMTKTKLTVNETVILNNINRQMFGVSSDWVKDRFVDTFYGDNNAEMKETKDTINKFFAEDGFKLPLFRIGGGSANNYLWKNDLTPEYVKEKDLGITELFNGVMSVDPDAKFSVTLNMETDTRENQLDLIRYLTLMPDDEHAIGSDGTNWAQERVDRGYKDPFPVQHVVLGNELDWLGGITNESGKGWSTEKYITECKAFIPRIREINPDLPIGIFTKTATNGFADRGESWNKEVIPALGPLVDYIVVHLYYHLRDAAYYEQVGADYDVIKKYMTEEYGNSHLKIYMEEHGMYADWGDPEKYPRIMSFEGMLSTAMFYCRRLRDPVFEAATFHGFAGENPPDDETFTLCSELLQAYVSVPYMLTGAGEIVKFFYENAGSRAVKSELTSTETGYFTDMLGRRCSQRLYAQQVAQADRATLYPSLNALVTTAENGGLNIIMANLEKDVTHQNIAITFDKGPYRLKEKTVISADSYDANITAATPDAVKFETTVYSGNEEFNSYTINPLEIVLLKLEPIGIEKTALSVEVKNTVLKKYRPTVDSALRTVYAQCTLSDAIADDKELDVVVLDTNMMPDEAEFGTNRIYTGKTTAKEAKEGVYVKMPEAADKGSYTLVVGDLTSQQKTYASTVFYYDTVNADAKTDMTISLKDAENNKITCDGEFVFSVETPGEMENAKYSFALYKGSKKITPNDVSDLVAIGAKTVKNGITGYTANVEPGDEWNGTYTLFVGKGPYTNENISRYEFDYTYEPRPEPTVNVSFSQAENRKIVADFEFTDIKDGALFNVVTVKPGYNLVSGAEDLKNVCSFEQIQKTAAKTSLEITLPKNSPAGIYRMTVSAENGQQYIFDVNYMSDYHLLIGGEITDQSGNKLTNANAGKATEINADIQSGMDLAASGTLMCCVYDGGGKLIKAVLDENISLAPGSNPVTVPLDGAVSTAAKIKLFLWQDMQTLVPLARHYETK